MFPDGTVLVPAVTMMHEQMHQWAGQKQKPRKIWDGCQQMGPVLGDQEKGPDREEANEDDASSRAPPWRLSLLIHRSRSVVNHRQRRAKKL
jgi:hypothetical protein